jgi:hypothetical protein
MQKTRLLTVLLVQESIAFSKKKPTADDHKRDGRSISRDQRPAGSAVGAAPARLAAAGQEVGAAQNRARNKFGRPIQAAE